MEVSPRFVCLLRPQIPLPFAEQICTVLVDRMPVLSVAKWQYLFSQHTGTAVLM